MIIGRVKKTEEKTEENEIDNITKTLTNICRW